VNITLPPKGGPKFIGVLAALATIATGVNNAAVFLCARHIT
jgi:hypothetical protein